MNNKNTLRTIAIILAALLAIAVIYIFNLKSQINYNTDEMVQMDAQRMELKTELDSLDLEYQSLENINLKQDSTLQATYITLGQKNDEIKKLMNKSNLSASEISSLKSQVSSLRSELKRFKSEVSRLTAENDYLRKSNDTLSTVNTMTRDTLSNVRGQYNTVQQEYQGAKSTISNTLAVSNFTITPLKVRKSGKEVEKDRASRVNKLEVEFDLDPNPKAQNGPKTLYIAIFKPDGTLATFKNGSTGKFTDKDGLQVNYSDNVTVNYSSDSGAKVEFDWDYDNFTPGTYKINVYQNGFKIGQESRTLNK